MNSYGRWIENRAISLMRDRIDAIRRGDLKESHRLRYAIEQNLSELVEASRPLTAPRQGKE